jgi:hypothetical protein
MSPRLEILMVVLCSVALSGAPWAALAIMH